MAIFGALVALLRADSTAWTAGMAAARKETDKTRAHTNSFFKQLKADFGKNSTLGQSLKLATGGGAIAALSMFGKEAAEAVKNINEFIRSTGTLSEKLAAFAPKVPLFGGWFQFGLEMQNLITGEGTRLEKQVFMQEQEVKLWERAADRIKKKTEAMKENIKVMKDMRDESTREIEMLRAKDKYEEGALKDKNDQDDKMAKIRKAIKEADDEVKRLEHITPKTIPESEALASQWIAAFNVLQKLKQEARETARALEALANVQSEKRASEKATEQFKRDLELEEERIRRRINLEEKWRDLKDNIAKADDLASATKRVQLPNPNVQAEQLFGRRTVTAGDLPPPFIETAKNTRETKEEVKKLREQNARQANQLFIETFAIPGF